MKEHDLSNRVFANEAEIDQACHESSNELTREQIESITRPQWTKHVD